MVEQNPPEMDPESKAAERSFFVLLATIFGVAFCIKGVLRDSSPFYFVPGAPLLTYGLIEGSKDIWEKIKQRFH